MHRVKEHRVFTWLVISIFLLISCASCHAEVHHEVSDDWDYLVFTQHWPITVCEHWKDESNTHSCQYPNPEQMWTIHGVWPTKEGTFGPFFCNRTWRFDPEQIRSIEPTLNELWINVEKETSTYSLWAHEWTKHGTCAAVLPSLGSEYHYFGQGIRWQKQFSMNTILAAADIFPHATKEYSIEDFHGAIKKKLGVEPVIQCQTEEGTNSIFELRICFNKKFELVDCAPSKKVVVSDSGAEIMTNCPKGKGILYPAMSNFSKLSLNSKLDEWYRFISWLQWFTL